MFKIVIFLFSHSFLARMHDNMDACMVQCSMNLTTAAALLEVRVHSTFLTDFSRSLQLVRNQSKSQINFL